MFKRTRKHGPIGLDLGASSVKLIQFAESQGRLSLIAAAHRDLPSASDAQAAHEAAAHAVRQLLATHRFEGREVVTALGHREYQLKSIRVPPMPPDEMESAVVFEAQERFDFGGATAQFRFLEAGEVRHGNELKHELMVFGATESVVQERLAFLQSLKLDPIAVDLSPCAVARSFVRFLRRAGDASAVNVFLDVGQRGTTILITRGTELVFLKVIDVGGQCMTDAVARSLAIPADEAAQLRLAILRDQSGRRGDVECSVPAEVRTAVADAVRPAADQIAKDVQLCLRYYAVTFRGQRAESVTLVGGEAHEPVLLKALQDAVDVPCMTGYPLRGVQNLGDLTSREERAFHPAWGVACGLALRGMTCVSSPAAGASHGLTAGRTNQLAASASA
ncbi:Competence protein A [Phycisphaerae bacterium RAS2]|nr:Competence protein A [Phycisphaerae bacterium RAS2]